MNKKIELSVVTVTYKPNIKELILFIESFYKFNDLGEEAQLVIVDNSPINSWDNSLILSQYPQLTLLSNPSNPGFGASNNMGFNQYTSKYVLFINNDVELLEPIFSKIINEFEKNEYIGCIGINQKGGAPSFFKKFDAPSKITNKQFIDKYHFISGAFMFFKSSIFEECGKFDENIFMYLEEYDISTRLINQGYSTVYLPQYSFLHKTGNRKIQNKKHWIYGTTAYCYICSKYQIDPYKYFSSKHLYKMLFYFILTLNFKQIKEIYDIIVERKRILQDYTQNKKSQMQ